MLSSYPIQEFPGNAPTDSIETRFVYQSTWMEAYEYVFEVESIQEFPRDS